MWPRPSSNTRLPPLISVFPWHSELNEESAPMSEKKAREIERERAHTYSLESTSKRIYLQIPNCCLLHARPWHFNKRRVPAAFKLGEKFILRAMCLCCLSQYICWRNCKLTFYYSSFHGRHWVRDACGFLRYYLNLSWNEEQRISFPLSCSDLLFSCCWQAVSDLTIQYGWDRVEMFSSLNIWNSWRSLIVRGVYMDLGLSSI